MVDDTSYDEKHVTEDGMWFENDLHQNAALETMKLMYDSRQLTDVCVAVSNQKFYCHRVVLAATSCFFRTMFTTSLAESQQTDVKLHEVDAESVNALIDYAYTGRVRITQLNVQNLMIAASLFQVAAVLEACARYMEQHLDDANCIGIFNFAHLHLCQRLCAKAMEHIEKNFQQVILGEEFLGTEPDLLLDILSSSELNVDHEETVFEALLHWVEFNVGKRARHLPRLLPAIRCGLLPLQYVREHILGSRFITEHCRSYLQSVEHFMVNPEECRCKGTLSPTCSTPRSGMIKPDHCILLLGGTDDSYPSVNCYNPLTRETHHFPGINDIVHSASYKPACVVTDDNQIFLGGGSYRFFAHLDSGFPEFAGYFYEEFDEGILRRHFFVYNSDLREWTLRAPMLFPKSNFALAYIGGKIYCFGGLSVHRHPSEVVECYDIAANQWKYVGMMPVPMVDLNAVVYDEFVYVLGGHTAFVSRYMLMRFDSRCLEWTTLAAVPSPRFRCGACIYSGEIFVIGGQDHPGLGPTDDRAVLQSVDIYSIEHDHWRAGPPLPVPLFNVGATVLEDSLYVCGTLEQRSINRRVYRQIAVYRLRLSPMSDMWHQVESDLSTVHGYLCVAARVHTRKLSQIFRPDVDT